MENGHEPATKADVRQVGEQLRSEFREGREQLRPDIRQGFADLKECLREYQAEVLKAFNSVAETIYVRLSDRERSHIDLRQRLTAVEVRLTEVEKRLHLPPAGASG